MTSASKAIHAELERVGMPAGDLPGRATLIQSAVDEFVRANGRAPAWAWWVPGRIELFGKHTDYAGGRSLVAAVPRGFAIVAGPRDDGKVVARDAYWIAEMECLPTDDTAVFKGWANYIAVVARRLAKNFPGADLGADLVFASDLPRAAGISSSSALVVGVALALARRANLSERQEWTAAIANRLDLAGYLGAVENGLTFGSLAGTAGVGTHGGSEDHTAILNAQPESFSAFSYIPVQPIGIARLPDDWRFVVLASGIEASKAGEALESYNRASLATRALLDVWSRHTGRPAKTLAAALAQCPREEFESVVASGSHPDFGTDDLLRRLAHFIDEDERVPRALQAVQDANRLTFGELATATQRDAENLLNNQIPETTSLAAMARREGAFGASSFGAGFGGSVWAMVDADDAGAFAERWQARYLQSFAPPKPVGSFIARPAPPATELSLNE